MEPQQKKALRQFFWLVIVPFVLVCAGAACAIAAGHRDIAPFILYGGGSIVVGIAFAFLAWIIMNHRTRPADSRK